MYAFGPLLFIRIRLKKVMLMCFLWLMWMDFNKVVSQMYLSLDGVVAQLLFQRSVGVGQ